MRTRLLGSVNPLLLSVLFYDQNPLNVPPKTRWDFGYEPVRASELKLFMVMCPISQKHGLGRGLSCSKHTEPHFEVNCTPNLNAAPWSPEFLPSAVMKLLLTMEKYELRNDQEILLSRKNPQNLWSTCNVCLRKRCLATPKQTGALPKSTGWNLSVKF